MGLAPVSMKIVVKWHDTGKLLLARLVALEHHERGGEGGGALAVARQGRESQTGMATILPNLGYLK